MRCLSSALSTETLSGGLPSPYTTPGTRPARRSARAAPLPARERVAAFICLTVVAMMQILLQRNGREAAHLRLAAACLQGCLGRGRGREQAGGPSLRSARL